MDDKGTIRQFKNDSEALKAGFKHSLSAEEAERLSELQPEDRVVEKLFFEYQRTILKGRKVDTIEKIRIKNVLRFASEYLKDKQ